MQHVFSSRWARHFIPNIGTLILMALMLLVYRASAAPNGPAAPDATPGTISYQGMLNDAAGQPVNGNTNITFRLYSASTGGTALWTEAHTDANAVPVSNGLFNVLLGSLTPVPASVWSNANVYLGVQVGGDAEMSPREAVSVVPTAMTVPDGAIGTAKIASDAITTTKIADGAIGAAKIASGAITTALIANGAVTPGKITALADEVFDGQSYNASNNPGTLENFGSTSLPFSLPYSAKVLIFLRSSIMDPTGDCVVTLNIDGIDYIPQVSPSKTLYLANFTRSSWTTAGADSIFTLGSGTHIIRPRFGIWNASTCTVSQVGYGYVVLGQ
jgi:hypothetical protein